MGKYTTLSEEAISYICGLLRDMASVSDAVDDIHLRTDGTFSSVKIDNLIKQVLADGKDYSEQLCSALVKLTCSKTTVQPTLDNSEINVIYLYSADGNAPFEQYLKISDTELVDMGSTTIDLSDYYDKTTADDKFAIKSDVTDIINLIGPATLETNEKTLKGAINEIKSTTDTLNESVQKNTDAINNIDSGYADIDTAVDSAGVTSSIDCNIMVTDCTKNLLNPTLGTTTMNGVTITNNGDGTYTVKGTATADTFFWFSSVKTDKNVSYNCLGTPYALGEFVRLIFVNNKTWQHEWGTGVIIKDCDEITPSIFVPNGKIIDAIVVKPMITTDLNATHDDFVPYSGYEIKSCRKNFIDYNKLNWNDNINSSHTFENGELIITRNGEWSSGPYLVLSSLIIKMFAGRKIRISLDAKSDVSGMELLLVFSYRNINVDNKFEITTSYERYASVFDFPKELVETTIICFYGNALAGKMYIKNIMFEDITEYDSGDYTYEPYKGESIAVNNDMELPKFGLKLVEGSNHIISPGNVKIKYPTNDNSNQIFNALVNMDNAIKANIANLSTSDNTSTASTLSDNSESTEDDTTTTT